MRVTIAMILSLAAYPAAGDISFGLPLDCALGETCFIQQFVDHDPTTGASDFGCGPLTYDGHKGTDFALPSRAALTAGVDVVAAAPGTVQGVRDGMADVLQNGDPAAPDVSGRECGNGVVISHGDGWETQYCHLANGSVAVRSGDRVAMGTVLGQVGLSGQTQFPHVHMSVRKDGAVVDPFDPDGQIACNAVSEDQLWLDEIIPPPGGMIAAGFAAGVPEYDDIKAGIAAANRLQTTDPLVVWGYLFGGRTGDQLRLIITGPNDDVIDHTETLDRTQAQLFRATGRRAPAGGWAIGAYQGEVHMIRNGVVLDTIQTNVVVR